MTTQELRELFDSIDPYTREALKRGVEGSNSSLEGPIKERLRRALSNEPIEKYRRTNVVYNYRPEEGLLFISIRDSSYLSVGPIKKEFLEKKRISGTWRVDGKPTHPDPGFTTYAFKRVRKKKKQSESVSFSDIVDSIKCLSPEDLAQLRKLI